MQDWRNIVLGKLVKERDATEIYRLQGELRAIDDIITLKGMAREYLKGLKDNKMKEIGHGKPVQV